MYLVPAVQFLSRDHWAFLLKLFRTQDTILADLDRDVSEPTIFEHFDNLTLFPGYLRENLLLETIFVSGRETFNVCIIDGIRLLLGFQSQVNMKDLAIIILDLEGWTLTGKLATFGHNRKSWGQRLSFFHWMCRQQNTAWFLATIISWKKLETYNQYFEYENLHLLKGWNCGPHVLSGIRIDTSRRLIEQDQSWLAN